MMYNCQAKAAPFDADTMTPPNSKWHGHVHYEGANWLSQAKRIFAAASAHTYDNIQSLHTRMSKSTAAVETSLKIGFVQWQSHRCSWEVHTTKKCARMAEGTPNVWLLNILSRHKCVTQTQPQCQQPAWATDKNKHYNMLCIHTYIWTHTTAK